MAVKFAGATPAQLEQYNKLKADFLAAESAFHKREATDLYNKERIDTAKVTSFHYQYAYYIENANNLYNDPEIFERFKIDFPNVNNYAPQNNFAYQNLGYNSQPIVGWTLPNDLLQLFGLKLAISYGNGLEGGGNCPPFTFTGGGVGGNTTYQYNDCAFKKATYQRVRLMPAQPGYNQYNDYGVDQMTGSISSAQFRSWFESVNAELLKRADDFKKEQYQKFSDFENFLIKQEKSYSQNQAVINAANITTALQQTVNDILKDPIKLAGGLLMIFALFALTIYLFKK